MSALESARYYMLGVLLCFVQFLVTVLAERAGAWGELAASWLVTWPLLGAWRRAS